MKSKIHIVSENLLLTFLSILKILVSSKISVKIPRKNSSTAIVLGNGPSLKDSLEKLQIQIEAQKPDLFCVNFFCFSDLYDKLKPAHYVINAPEFWLPDVDQEYLNLRKKFINTILSKTSWPLHIYMPYQAQKHKWLVQALTENSQISISVFNTTPVEGFKGFCQTAYDFKLGMPRPHNVLIPTLFMAIYLRFENVFLLGADHSWLREIFVTEENLVLLSQKHFYDVKDPAAKPMKKIGSGNRKLHEVLEKFTYSFKAYFDINEYAKQKKVNIYNSTPGSYIDAFDRKEP
ncbi:MAG: hypothetical protein ACNS62_06170 [Candidatus Cyclobacteriaceae bacterium M3_2C_046]